jgi:hypothetical protein
MARWMALLAATALAALVVAPGVTAGKPVKFPILNEPLSLEGICDFRLDGEPVGPQRQKGFEFEDGRIVFNGQLTVRVWNADDPSKALETTASGPVFLLPNPDGTLTVKGTGVNIWFFFPGDLGPGGARCRLPGQGALDGADRRRGQPRARLVRARGVHREPLHHPCLIVWCPAD